MKRKLIKFGIITFSICFILFMALGIHLYYVTDNFYQNAGSQLQMSRIDFKQDVDSAQAVQIKSFVNHLDDVEKSYFNEKDHILVYSFYTGKQTSQNVYDQLMQSGNYDAERYIVSEEAKLSGCPAMGDKSSSGLLNVYKKMFSMF